jgi:glutamate transport system permease protein
MNFQQLDFGPLLDQLPAVLRAFWATIRLALVAGVGSLIFGTVLASMRVSPTPVLRTAGAAYIYIFRNTPLTLVLIFCSLGLSDTLHLQVSSDPQTNGFWLAALGMTVYTSSFVCESLRAGINTVPLGQAEAARSIGLTFTQSLRLVVMPQAFRAVIAPLGSVFIAMIKNTTVALAASYFEASAQMKQMFDAPAGGVIPIFIGFAIGFMVLTLPTGFFFGWLSKRLAVAR